MVAVVLLMSGRLDAGCGQRWWTLLWFPLALLEWFHLLSPGPHLTRFWFHRNPKFREPYELAFDDEGIRFRTPTIDSHLAWATYSRVLEDERVWLLVYGSRMYTVVPKRAFDDEGRRTFRDLVSRHVGRNP